MSDPSAGAAPGAPLAERLPTTRDALLSGVIVAWSALWYVGYSWTAAVRLDLADRPAGLAILVLVLAGLWLTALLRPLSISLLLLLSLPLFGNHPGGRLMELVNLPLAAAAAGLALEARRQHRPLPSGALWLAAALYVASATVAFVASMPNMAVQAAALNHWPTVLHDGLVAPEDNPLYAVSSLVELTLCATWSAALAWRAPGREWVLRAVRVLIAAFFAVVAVGILDHHELISITHSYHLVIDPRPPLALGFRSIFWNTGWYAWYFVMIFALALGFLWSARTWERRIVAVLLAVSYVYLLANPQRGGFVIVNGCLALAAAAFVFASRHRQGAHRAVTVAALLLVLAVGGAYTLEYVPHSASSSLFRLLAASDEVQMSNSMRANLWAVAMLMWRDAPLFGLGEGSFSWRFEEYAQPGSPLYSPVHGDAHSTWLQILATRGLFGVLSFVALLWAVGWRLYEEWRRNPGQRGLVIGLGLSCTGFLVYSSVQGMFYLQAIQILFWFVVGMAAPSDAARRGVGGRRWVPLAAAAGVGVALLAQAAMARPLFVQARETIGRQPRGFYPPETGGLGPTPWRWSVREGTLCLQPVGTTVRLRMLAGDPRSLAYPRLVTLRINDRVVGRFEIPGPGVVTRVLPLPASRSSERYPQRFGECTGRDDIRLTVAIDRSWSPLSAGVGNDARVLGIAVFEPSYPAVDERRPAGRSEQ